MRLINVVMLEDLGPPVLISWGSLTFVMCLANVLRRSHATHCVCQVEIKLRLEDEEAHSKLGKALEPHFRETHKQENIFYDGAEGELSRQRVIVRTRFYNTDKRCLLTIKVGTTLASTPLVSSQHHPLEHGRCFRGRGFNSGN
jgi:hypothetical protein